MTRMVVVVISLSKCLRILAFDLRVYNVDKHFESIKLIIVMNLSNITQKLFAHSAHVISY